MSGERPSSRASASRPSRPPRWSRRWSRPGLDFIKDDELMANPPALAVRRARRGGDARRSTTTPTAPARR